MAKCIDQACTTPFTNRLYNKAITYTEFYV